MAEPEFETAKVYVDYPIPRVPKSDGETGITMLKEELLTKWAKGELVEIVRCRDCRYGADYGPNIFCTNTESRQCKETVGGDYYCPDGKKRENGDAHRRKRGSWIQTGMGLQCSNCYYKLQITGVPQLCPNCGAEMRVEQSWSSTQSDRFDPCTICQEFDCTGCKFMRTGRLALTDEK